MRYLLIALCLLAGCKPRPEHGVAQPVTETIHIGIDNNKVNGYYVYSVNGISNEVPMDLVEKVMEKGLQFVPAGYELVSITPMVSLHWFQGISEVSYVFVSKKKVDEK